MYLGIDLGTGTLKAAIFDAAGTCVMPSEGIFCKVLRGGTIKAGDSIEEDA